MKPNNIADFKSYYENLRSRNKHQAELLLQNVKVHHPEVIEALDAWLDAMHQATKAKVVGADAEYVSSFEKNASALAEAYSALLEKLHLPTCFPAPQVECEKCQDTGYDQSSGVALPCDCFKYLLQAQTIRQLSERLELPRFASWRSDVYITEETVNTAAGLHRRNPREINQVVMEALKARANLATTDMGLIYLSGRTGIGKTWLLGAMARVFLERSFSVYFLKGVELVSDLTSYWRMRNSAQPLSERQISIERFQKIKRSQILLVDDLPERPDLACLPVLADLIDERIASKLPFVITSNMSLKDLNSHYGERIKTRISSQSVFYLVGDDVRQKLSGAVINQKPSEVAAE